MHISTAILYGRLAIYIRKKGFYMLSISPNFTGMLSSINRTHNTNPVTKNTNQVSFRGKTDGTDEQDIFVRKATADTLSEQEKKEYAKKLEQVGYEAFSQKQYTSCIESLKKALAINPDSARAWHAKGSAEKELGQYEESIADYTKAFELRPDSANSVGLRGLSKAKWAQEIEREDFEYSRELYSSAISDYDKSIELNPNNPDIYDYKANALMNTNKYREAIDALEGSIILNEDILAKNPDNTGVKIKLANAHHKKGKCLYTLAPSPYSPLNTEARDEFTQALEYTPGSANTYYERAKVNKRIDTEQAKADIEKAIELASDRPRYWEFYGNMLIMSDNEADRDMGFECIATALKLRSEQN